MFYYYYYYSNLIYCYTCHICVSLFLVITVFYYVSFIYLFFITITTTTNTTAKVHVTRTQSIKDPTFITSMRQCWTVSRTCQTPPLILIMSIILDQTKPFD